MNKSISGALKNFYAGFGVGLGVASLTILTVIAVLALFAIMPIVGALFGWFLVWVLSLVFVFDYEIGRTVGMVMGAVGGFRYTLSSKD